MNTSHSHREIEATEGWLTFSRQCGGNHVNTQGKGPSGKLSTRAPTQEEIGFILTNLKYPRISLDFLWLLCSLFHSLLEIIILTP